MNKRQITCCSALLLCSLIVFSGTKNKPGANPERSATYYESGKSKFGNQEFVTTNYGVVGNNIQTGGSGWLWPRNSGRAYIYGSGIWFGAKKIVGMDTVKAVSVGYNPNTGRSWLVPGSIDDGWPALDDTDIRSANYILYRSTEYNAAGKNLYGSAKPDWPIRWKDLSKVPGKNGYFGDYIAAPAERSLYRPVYISQEDFFCIYKDTDVRNNPEYQPNKGYPLGIEVEQTMYTWGFDGHKELVFTVYNVKNKSGSTLRDCYISSAFDPDIGGASNDHLGYYSKDSTLNMAFVFTEPETNYPGVIGFDFLQSPRIKTPEDSARFRAQTGRIRKVGEQIGLTTVRNWVIENDPSGATGRYDFMASNVRDGDFGPGDKRLLIATGPFTMNAGDSARVVMCTMIAPGNGNPLAGDVLTNSYLDSLISLDAYAQSVFENDRLRDFPFASVHTTVAGTLADVALVVDGSRTKAKTVLAKLVTTGNVVVAQGALFDDGNHNDSLAGDKIFGNTISVSAQATGLSATLQITDDNNTTTEWTNAVTAIATTKLTFGQPVILADNQNSDGKANAGEWVRLAVPVMNTTDFPFTNLTLVLNATNAAFIGKMAISSLSPKAQFNPVYDSLNPGSYLEFRVPPHYAGTTIHFDVSISDTNDNHWNGAVDLDIAPLIPEKAVNYRLSGRSAITPNVIIADKVSVMNHAYVIQGVDSANSARSHGFIVKDSMTSSILQQATPLNYNGLNGFSSPVIDGFKVLWKGDYTAAMDLQWWRYFTADSSLFPWFNSNFAVTGNNIIGNYAVGDLNFGDYRDVKIRFSKRTSFIDVNANLQFDPGEPYGYDSSNAQRSQRAYYYRRESPFITSWKYAGFKSVPFAAFDIESGVPRQLDIVVLDHDKNNQWDIEPAGISLSNSNNMFIMSTTYDPEGKRYDSTKGGTNLIPAFRYKQGAPIYFMLQLTSNGASPMSVEGEVELYTSRPLSSRDAFLINPAITTEIRSGNGSPNDYSLSQNYPNPFNPSTTIHYSVKHTTRVSLKIFNILGQHVKTLVNTEQNSGGHTVQWDGTNMLDRKVSSGMYFYRIEAGNFTDVKKMIMIQ